MKLLDIEHDRVQLQFGVISVKAVGVLKEEIAAVEPRQRVFFRRGDELTPLAQLDYPSHAG